jgi:hypothetical protein
LPETGPFELERTRIELGKNLDDPKYSYASETGVARPDM